jgi:hypothetical protein
MTVDASLLAVNSKRPVYRLFDLLLSLSGTDGTSTLMTLEIFEKTDGQRLIGIAATANTLQRTVHLGTAAIARCLALAAPDATDSDQCSPDTVEAIGWLLAELADLAAICHHLETTARRVEREPS